jgi:hypothetical protein
MISSYLIIHHHLCSKIDRKVKRLLGKIIGWVKLKSMKFFEKKVVIKKMQLKNK